ncbi:type 1 periplasmic binding fold superfamily protein [Aquimarina sp. U1-2]|uniref:type 1 periplasmic binding fold superfamily protein n=1 Tax=Aquimarina sp. U1-2 TaxID=2823141 RepID=UPI001AECD160|nr:type 1 periplasmic binding fold superfamily protein [Aquimarina sp. U1-2]MBP2831168.1 type 1 periplasmic binding fold superfamily protein [Aquimarina sp. U1-2]
MMNLSKFLTVFLIGALFLTSCSDDDDDPNPANDPEVITTMTVTLINPTDANNVVTLNFLDPDGDIGSTSPTSNVEGELRTNTTYNGSIVLLNTTENPVERVNEEIEGEADEHQFFYLTSDLGITTAYTDQECDYNEEPCEGTNARPVGITFTLTTTDATGTGDLRVLLLHELDKDAEGVAGGNDTNAGGEADIDWTFENIVVQ